MNAKKPYSLVRPLDITASDGDENIGKGVFLVYDRYRFDIVELPLEFAEKKLSRRDRSNSIGMSFTKDKSLVRSLSRNDRR